MRNTRKLFCALLVAALLVLSIAPAYAVSVDTKAAKIYLGSKDGSQYGWYSIEIRDLTAKSKITEIKSDDKKVAKVYSLDTWSSSYKYFDEEGIDSEYHSASIGIRGLKTGTATVSFKVDGKKYSKKFTVLGYENPAKNFQLTGINKTNLKSKFAKGSYAQAKLKADSKAGNLVVEAAKGWKITDATWSDQGEDYSSQSFYSSKGVSSVKLAIPKMTKKGNYYIWVTFVNTATKASVELAYNIG